MKTPYRYLIGIAAGLAAGFLLKTGNPVVQVLDVASDTALRLGRYLVIPLMFFSLPVAVTQLRRLGKLGSVAGRSALYTIIASAVLTIAGTLVVWLIDFGRIPVVPGSTDTEPVVGLRSMVEQIFDMNGFRVLTGDASFVLPMLLPAFLLGWHMVHDREIAEPAFNLFDSLSRLLYRVNRYQLVLMPLLLALLTARIVIESRRVVDFARFLPLLGVLTLMTLVLIFGVYPLVLYFAGGRRSPWRTMGGLSGAFLGAFVSASALFNYGNLVRHLKENLGIPRHTTALLTPVFLMFARAGTALVSSVCMLAVIRSYSSLEITLFQASWAALFSFLLSFALPASPDRGVPAALIMLGALYGRGLEDGWMILAPVLPLAGMLSVLIDTAVATLFVILVNRRADLESEQAAPAVNF